MKIYKLLALEMRRSLRPRLGACLSRFHAIEWIPLSLIGYVLVGCRTGTCVATLLPSHSVDRVNSVAIERKPAALVDSPGIMETSLRRANITYTLQQCTNEIAELDTGYYIFLSLPPSLSHLFQSRSSRPITRSQEF